MSDWVTLRDTLGLTLRPIDAWPGKQRFSYDRSPYSAPLKDTLKVLKRELGELNAREIVLQVAIPEEKLRLDGLPRAGATAEHPGVILSFTGKHGPLRIHFNRFTLWHQNLRAIAMHLYDLRHASLYGVGADGEQYRGWKALPGAPADVPSSADASPSARPAARRWTSAQENAAQKVCILIERQGDWHDLLEDPAAFRSAYHEAASRTHPDAGYSEDQFHTITGWVNELKSLHGLK